MSAYVVSAVGRDRPGIIAGVAERLVAHGVNITDSQSSILRGHFAMTLVVTAPEDVDEARLGADLRAAAEELELEALSVRRVEEAAGRGDPTHVVTVYGADHPGIVAAVTRALADGGVNVCSLETRLLGEEEGAPLYVMVMEVAPHGALDDEALRAVGAAQGVEVSVRPLEPDVL